MVEERLSKAAFLEMAAVVGVESGNREYLDLLYEEVKAMLRLVSVLDEPDLTGVEPASVYSTGYGLPGAGRERG